MLGLDRTQAYTLGVFGEYGSGKSLFLLELAFYLADKRCLKIAANFYINPRKVRKFARAIRSRHLALCSVVQENDITKLMTRQQSVILLDEAGVKTFCRDFNKIDKSFFENLFQMRKNGNVLILAAQGIDQIDAQLEDRIEKFLLCKSIQYPSRKLRRMALYSRSVRCFSPAGWARNHQDEMRQFNPLKTAFDSGFNCYRSNYFVKHLIRKLAGHLEFWGDFWKICKQHSLGLIDIINYAPKFHQKYSVKYWSRYWVGTTEDLLFECYDSYSLVGSRGRVRSRRFVEYREPSGAFLLRVHLALLIAFPFNDDNNLLRFPISLDKAPALSRGQKIKAILQAAKGEKLPMLKLLNDNELDSYYRKYCV